MKPEISKEWLFSGENYSVIISRHGNRKYRWSTFAYLYNGHPTRKRVKENDKKCDVIQASDITFSDKYTKGWLGIPQKVWNEAGELFDDLNIKEK